MKYVKSQDLKKGMIIAMAIYSNTTELLLAANTALTDITINRIRKLGYKGLYVYDSNDIEVYKPLLSNSTRLSAIRNLKHLNIDSCLFVANSITNEILQNPEMLYNLISVSSYDNITYTHSINVAVFATMIGINMGFDNDKLYKITQAGILHDIGKVAIDSNIIKKEGKLTDDEYEEVKKHTLYGYNMVKNNEMISSVVRSAIYSHHENEDGSGYPRGVKGNQIHIVAKILHCADVYDALTSKRSYKDELPPDIALRYMQSKVGTLFDGKVVEAMMHCIAAYPLYTTVLLSNGETATVKEVHTNNITKPVVCTEKGETIDLASSNLRIVKSLL